ncbi:MAG: sigma-70 family RNA polymerase sigma factor [Acidobacteriota bacterium]
MVTQLLHRWRGGESDAAAELLPIVYQELRQVAAKYLRSERGGHTLQTTALVHEAYLRLTGGNELAVKDRAHFFRIAAQTMRRVLVDHARKQHADKRVGAHQKIDFGEVVLASAPPDFKILAVHDALELLAEIQPRQARLVELLYFGGLTQEEAAEALDISLSTLARDWRVARRWLYAQLAHGT